MAAVVNIISRQGPCIDECYTNQPNRNKLALCKPLIHIYSHLIQLYIHSYICNKIIHFSYKDVCGGHGCCMHIHVFKEDLAWATDKKGLMLFKTVSYVYH